MKAISSRLIKASGLYGVAATLFLLGGFSADATTYTYTGNTLTWTTSCTPLPGQTLCSARPPLASAMDAVLHINFDTSNFTGTLTNGSPSGVSDWSRFSYLSGPFSGPVGSDPEGLITLTDGQVTSWFLTGPSNHAGPSAFGEQTTSGGDSAFFSFSTGGPGSSSGSASAPPGTWSGPMADAFTTPLPAALPLFATGLGALGLLGRRRKRKPGASLLAAS